MGWSSFAVLCGILTFATSNGSNSWQMIQLTGKARNDVVSSKPEPYSSIVYLINDVEIFCYGVLIAPKYFLSDGFCGKDIITFNHSDIASSTKVYDGDVPLEADECGNRYIDEVIYEKPEDPVEKYDGLLIAMLTRSLELSPRVSLAYLPKQDIKLIGKHAVIVELDEMLHLKPEHVIITRRSGVILTVHRLSPAGTFIHDVQVGAPIFQESNFVGMYGIFSNKFTSCLDTACLKNIQPSYDFITNFASCGGEFDESRNDPGHSSIGGESSSNA